MVTSRVGSLRAVFDREIGPSGSGYLLGGRVRYAQPGRGFRSGIEPVLLAAAVPAVAGERVLDGGTGAGPALLCLAARVPQLCGVGIEHDMTLAELARENMASNGLSETFEIVTGELTTCADIGLFSHACANPPWHSPEGTASPVLARTSAKRVSANLLEAWASTLARRLRPGGTLTMILAAPLASEACRVIESAGLGSLAMLPLWPKRGQAARLLLVQAIKSATGRCRILPGLTLHGDEGEFSDPLRALLYYGASLSI